MSEVNGQRIVMDIPAGQTCLADPKMLKKALSNIILNAVQNTPQGARFGYGLYMRLTNIAFVC
nr:hypothetical protein [Desulforamulus aquiferis]